MNPNSIFVGMLTGAVGTGYLVYGKKQTKLVPAVCGILLMIYPYFTDNIWWLLIIGVVLIAAPWVIKIE